MSRKRPALALVREGNPGHRAASDLEGGLTLPRGAPDEPSWQDPFPTVRVPSKKKARESLAEFESIHAAKLVGLDDAEERLERLMTKKVAAVRSVAQEQQDVNRRARAIARQTWRHVVAVLDPAGLLTPVDLIRLQELSVVVARIDQLERELSVRGMNLQGERGWKKNGASTQVAQYRNTLEKLAGAFGLDPVARDSLASPTGVTDDAGSPFD